MFKKFMLVVLAFTAGECFAYSRVNKEANRIATRDSKPALVMLPERWHQRMWVAMTTDPTDERPVYPSDLY